MLTRMNGLLSFALSALPPTTPTPPAPPKHGLGGPKLKMSCQSITKMDVAPAIRWRICIEVFCFEHLQIYACRPERLNVWLALSLEHWIARASRLCASLS